MICITKPICGPDSSLCCTILNCPRALKESTEGFLCRNKLQQWQTTRVSSDTSPRSSHRHKCSAEAAGMRSTGQCWNKDLKAEVTISVLLGFPTPYTAEQSPPSLNSQSQAVLNWVYQFLIFAVKPLPAIQLKNHKVLFHCGDNSLHCGCTDLQVRCILAEEPGDRTRSVTPKQIWDELWSSKVAANPKQNESC